MYNLLKDENELRLFYDRILPPLKEDEVYYVSLSCRGKYMKDEPKNFHKRLGSSEMFERRIIREHDWNKFKRTILKYCCEEGAYTFDDGVNIPIESMAVYFTITPSSMLKAVSEFGQKFISSLTEIALGQGCSLSYLKHLDREILSCIHKAKGTKHYIDIDMDLHEGKKHSGNDQVAIAHLTQELYNKDINYFIIDTRSGYHILMKKDSIHFNYVELLQKIEKEYKEVIKELKVNGNQMIPLPGTSQGGHTVKVLYDRSYF